MSFGILLVAIFVLFFLIIFFPRTSFMIALGIALKPHVTFFPDSIILPAMTYNASLTLLIITYLALIFDTLSLMTVTEKIMSFLEELKLIKKVNKDFSVIRAEAGIVGKGTKEQHELSEEIHRVSTEAYRVNRENL